MRRLSGLLLALVLLAAPVAVHAQPAAACTDDLHRQFDFWEGTWEVENAAGQRAGRNTITSAERGCLLVERWTGAQGGTGTSMNYVDPETGRWKQLWVAAGGSVIELEGELNDEGAMVLEGVLVGRGGARSPLRGIWTPLPDGRVRQLFEQRGADGEWTTWFDGYYTKSG